MVAAVFFVAVAPAVPASAQTAPAIHFELGNWDLRRRVELVAAGADVVHAATDAALGKFFETARTSRDGRGRLFRITKLYAIDLPTVAVAHTLGHEYGHASRTRENLLPDKGFEFENWPWPVPFVNAHGNPGGSLGFFDRPLLGIESGGYEAGRVRDRQFEDRFAAGGVNYFDASRLIYSRLEEPLAALLYLSESRIREHKLLLFDDSASHLPPDDMTVYALTLTNAQYFGVSLDNATATARRIRKGARWALADLQLAGSFYRVANYLWTGERVGEVPAIAVSGNRFWPRATFALTSAGVSRGAEVLWVRGRTSIKLHTEKTEQAAPVDIVGYTDRGRALFADQGRSRWGGGFALSSPVKLTRFRIEGNYWNQDTTGRGGSVEGRVERGVDAWPSKPRASLTIGYKTKGFLAGAPDAARWFVSAGLTIRPGS